MKSKIKSYLSDIYINQGKYDIATLNATESYNIARESNNKQLVALTLKSLGTVYFCQNIFDKSLNYYTKSLKIFFQLDNLSGIVSCYNNIALIHYKRKKYNVAERCFMKAKALCNAMGFYSLNMLIMNNLGNIYFYQGNLNKAEDHFSKCLLLSEDSQDMSTMIASYLNLGNIFQETNIEKSKTYYLKGLELCQKIGEKSKESYFYNVLGDISKNQKEYNSANKWYKKSIQIRNELGEVENEIYSRIKLLELLDLTKNKEEFNNEFDNVESLISNSSLSNESKLHFENEMKNIKN